MSDPFNREGAWLGKSRQMGERIGAFGRFLRGNMIVIAGLVFPLALALALRPSLDVQTNLLTHITADPPKSVTALAWGPNSDSVFVGTQRGTIYRLGLDGSATEQTEFLSANPVVSLAPDPQGTPVYPVRLAASGRESIYETPLGFSPDGVVLHGLNKTLQEIAQNRITPGESLPPTPNALIERQKNEVERQLRAKKEGGVQSNLPPPPSAAPAGVNSSTQFTAAVHCGERVLIGTSAGELLTETNSRSDLKLGPIVAVGAAAPGRELCDFVASTATELFRLRDEARHRIASGKPPLRDELSVADNGAVMGYGSDGGVLIWRPEQNFFLSTEETLGQPNAPGEELRDPAGGWKTSAAAFSPIGDLFAVAGNDGVIRVVLLGSGLQPTATVRVTGHRDVVTHMAISPDGRYLASAGIDGRLLLTDLEKVKSLTRWPPWLSEFLYLPTGPSYGEMRRMVLDVSGVGRANPDGSPTGNFGLIVGGSRSANEAERDVSWLRSLGIESANSVVGIEIHRKGSSFFPVVVFSDIDSMGDIRARLAGRREFRDGYLVSLSIWCPNPSFNRRGDILCDRPAAAN